MGCNSSNQSAKDKPELEFLKYTDDGYEGRHREVQSPPEDSDSGSEIRNRMIDNEYHFSPITSPEIQTSHDSSDKNGEHREVEVRSHSGLSAKYHQANTEKVEAQPNLSEGMTTKSYDQRQFPVEKSMSPLTKEGIRRISAVNTNDNSAEMLCTLEEKMTSGECAIQGQNQAFNRDTNKIDEGGYTRLVRAVLEGNKEQVEYVIAKGANPSKACKDGLTPLHAAAREEHGHIIGYLILQGADVNAGCVLGRTPLHIASAKGYVDVIDSLIKGGADVNKADAKGGTPFNAAVQYGHLEAVKYLIDVRAKQNRCDGATPLYAAAEFGHLDLVKFFILNGADVNEETEHGKIPLHGASIRGHIDIMEYLVQQGSDVNKGDTKGCTPFNAAVQYGHLEAVKCLIKVGANQNKYIGTTPLYTATELGRLDIVTFLVNNGADVNEENDGTMKHDYHSEKGRIPLHEAAAQGHVDIMEYLIQQGSDVNKGDAKGWTPLNAAVEYGHPEAVKCLIDVRAKQNNYSGMTPLYTATLHGRLDIVKILASKGADVNEENDEMMMSPYHYFYPTYSNKGEIPLHMAAAEGRIDIMEYLIQQGSDVNKGDVNGWTPFNAAVQYGHLEAVKYLLTQGMKQNNYSGMTPLYTATFHGRLDIVKILVSEGADVNEENDKINMSPYHYLYHTYGNKGEIPLHEAAAKGYIDIMEYLIQQGSDVNKGDVEGWTPLNAAVQYGHLEAVKLLINAGAKQNRDNGMTPLYVAAKHSYLDIVKFFISTGADVNEEDEAGKIPLHGAAAGAHIDVIDYLIQQGSDVNKGDAKGWTPLNAAVHMGRLEAVKYLLTKGVKQNRYDGMTPLYAAAQLGHLDIVKFFISNGADVNEEHDEGMIPLHGACAEGYIDIMEYLIQQGSDVNKGNAKGCTPFYSAVRYGHLEAVKYLLIQEVKQNRYDGMTPLYVAAQSGHLDIVKFFISNGAHVNEEDDEGMIPLHAAASGCHIDVMEYLIQQGCDVNKGDVKGWTPFHAAVQYGHLEAVKYLINVGANMNNFDGMTTLYIAAQSGHLNIIKYLIGKGADVNEADNLNQIPLHGASVMGKFEVIQYLVQKECDLNKEDHRGWTPLHAAVQNGYLDVVKFLVEKGAKCRKFDGLTPLYIAAQNDHTDVVKFLISEECDLNDRNSHGKSPLHAACYKGNIAMVKCLLLHNANVNAQDDDGWTPLHAAAQEGHQDIMSLLVDRGANITVVDDDGLTPFQAAINAGHLQILTKFSRCCDGDDGDIHDRRSPDTRDVTEEALQIEEDRKRPQKGKWNHALPDQRRNGNQSAPGSCSDDVRCGRAKDNQSANDKQRNSSHYQVDNLATGDKNGIPSNVAKTTVGPGPGMREGNNQFNHSKLKSSTTYAYEHNSQINHHAKEGCFPTRHNKSSQDVFVEGHHLARKTVHANSSLVPIQAKKRKKIESPFHRPTGQNEHPHERSRSRYNTFPGQKGRNKVNLYKTLKAPVTLIYAPGHRDSLRLITINRARMKSARTDEHDSQIYHGKERCFPIRYNDKSSQNVSVRGHTLTRKKVNASLLLGPTQAKGKNEFKSPFHRKTGQKGHPHEGSRSGCNTLSGPKEWNKERTPKTDISIDLERKGRSKNLRSDAPARQEPEFDQCLSRQRRTFSEALGKINHTCRFRSSQHSSLFATIQGFWSVIITLTIILISSVLIVACSGMPLATLQAGKSGVVPFHFSWNLDDMSEFTPYFILRFQSKQRPFCINGEIDINGYKSHSQSERFVITIATLPNSLCVNMTIDEVDPIDEDTYIMTTLLVGFKDVFRETVSKDIRVRIPPGPARCFITRSESIRHLSELHCEARKGTAETGLTCYQDGQKLDTLGGFTNNGPVTRGVFLLPRATQFSCCSHDINVSVSETMCNDFEWPPIRKSTQQSAVQTSRTPTRSNKSSEKQTYGYSTPSPHSESELESRACQHNIALPVLMLICLSFVLSLFA